MKKPFDTFDHFEGKYLYPEDVQLDSGFVLYVCKHCGAEKEIPLSHNRDMVDETRATLKDHLSLCEVYNKINRRSLLERLIEEGERSGKSPWCCDLLHETRAYQTLNHKHFPKHFPQESMEETVMRREKERNRDDK